jgi:hypothetical protein
MNMSDLYPGMVKNAPPSTQEQTAPAGAVERGASVSWLAVLVLFIVFRIAYEMAE